MQKTFPNPVTPDSPIGIVGLACSGLDAAYGNGL